MTDEDSVEKRQELQKVLAAWETFISSPGYPYYIGAREAEIEIKRDELISIDPIDRKDEIEAYKMRGDLRTTEEFLTLFEETVANLKNRIEQMLETEQQSGNNKKT